MHKEAIKRTSLRVLRRQNHPRQPTQHVHFHQGPQGQPMPCYDSHCTSPRLSI